MKKIIKICTYITLGLCIAVLLMFVVPIVPISGNYQVRVVLSGSMEPTIKTGGIVFFRPAASYTVGDIIVFMSQSFRDDAGRALPVTHRIVDIQRGEFETRFITKGDANDSPDSGSVSATNILGKEFLTLPYLGYAIESARSRYGFLILIMIPTSIIVYDEVKKIIREVGRIKQEKERKKIVKLKIEPQ